MNINNNKIQMKIKILASKLFLKIHSILNPVVYLWMVKKLKLLQSSKRRQVK